MAALKASLKPQATVKRDGKWQNMDAGLLVPGDLVLLASGSAVPADCLLNEGQIDVDQAALTGESLPVTMYPGDSAKMGEMRWDERAAWTDSLPGPCCVGYGAEWQLGLQACCRLNSRCF